MFGRRDNDGSRKFLIVGLGNIGGEYAETRHNIGFKVLDAFAEESNTFFESARYGARADVKLKGRTLLLLKPSTYMNLSGDAVRYWMKKEKIEPENILIILDDLALPLGTIRLRGRGNDGGHNGLRSIDASLGTNAYPRLRCGIGNSFPQGHQVNYVLGEWDEDEKTTLSEVIKTSGEVIKSFAMQGVERTMNLYNKKGIGKPKAE